MVLNLFVEVLKKVLKSLKFELKNPAETLNWLTIINILIRNKTDSVFIYLFFTVHSAILYCNVGHNGGTWKAKFFLRWY